MQEQTKFGKFHDRHYKTMLLLPIVFFLVCAGYMFHFYSIHNDFIDKDISLTGGTTVTLQITTDVNKITQDLSGKLEEVSTRSIYDLITQEQKAVIIETKSDEQTTKKVLEGYLGYTLTEENSSFEFTGSSLSESFYKQLLLAIIIAFILMAIVIFIVFRTFVPSMAVIISAFADIFMTLAVVDFLGIKVSSAGLVAFLMLIGYSVDTDILLSTRMLKRSDACLNDRIASATKTGLTMSLTSLFAILFAFFIVKSFSVILSQIFLILIIGLFFDIFNTWITNVSILKWYMVKHETHI